MSMRRIAHTAALMAALTWSSATRAIDLADVQSGLAAAIGEGLADEAIYLAEHTRMTIYLQTPDRADALRARQALHGVGLLGTRVYVTEGPANSIHLADNLLALVIMNDRDAQARTEAMRVLHPGGRLHIGDQTVVKPVPQGLGAWSHPYHGPDNNPQADDALARAPYLTHYLATPWYGPMPQVTVTSGGRMFKAFGHVAYKQREWPLLNTLLALNAYNGAELWRRDLKPGLMIHRNTMIAAGDVLYIADDEACLVLDAATGEVRDRIVVPDALDAADGPMWKWMALEGGVLYALVGEKELIDETLKGESKGSGWPWSGMGKGYGSEQFPWGFGRTLLAIDPVTKKLLWSRRESDLIDSRSMCMAGKRLFIYSDGKFLAALDVSTGNDLWRTGDAKLLEAIGPHDRAQNPVKGYASTNYAKASEKMLYFAGPQRKKLVAVDAATGQLKWTGEDGNVQLVLRPDAIYAMARTANAYKLDPLTGRVLAQFQCQRGNCTRATGTADSIFARGENHGGTVRIRVDADTHTRLPAMRPACQDGVIAANGLLYWGPWMCDCNHSLVGMIALAPAGEFAFERDATDAERLETFVDDATKVAAFDIAEADWPTYRARNIRNAYSPTDSPAKPRLLWKTPPRDGVEPTAPVAAGGLVLFSGSDGVVHALDAATGETRWTNYTGGPVRYPPSVWNGRVYVGSGDGYVYAFEAATGRSLWRFRAAPVDRRIPVYGRLASTWPVNSGVLVADGVAYAAAGITSLDGTHVYALDAVTGRIRWQNNTSGRLADDEAVCGVSVQGHLLLHDGKLYMAGGNFVSPAVYDAATGRCLNEKPDLWHKAPRGSELFLIGHQVEVIDQMLFSPREYIPSRYYRKYMLQADAGDIVIRGSEKVMMRLDPKSDPAKPTALWQNDYFLETSGVVLTNNAVWVIGSVPDRQDRSRPLPALMMLNPADGSTPFGQQLPAPAAPWGIAIDREGRIIITLTDGSAYCFGAG